MDVTTCPGCGAPAEVTDRCALESTSGPIEHVRVECANRHWFLLSVATLARFHHRGPIVPATAAGAAAGQRSARPARRQGSGFPGSGRPL